MNATDPRPTTTNHTNDPVPDEFRSPPRMSNNFDTVIEHEFECH